MSSLETFGVIGYGEFGRVAAEHLAPAGVEVLVHDPKLDVVLAENARASSFRQAALADVVLVAVPFDAYPAVIPEVASTVSDDALVIDVCSVKVQPMQVFREQGLLGRDNVLLTHPLFGPQSTVNGVGGKSIVVTHSQGQVSETMLDGWQGKGVEIVSMTADEHDREMARVHVLPFIIGRSLLQMGITESPLTTNYFGKLLSLIDVERQHSPELFMTIQKHNPYASNMRSELIATMLNLHAEICAAGLDDMHSEDPMEQLSAFRGVLDVIDGYRDELLGLRFQITERVGQLKARTDLPPVDPVREAAQQSAREEHAQALGIPTDLAVALHRQTVEAVAKRHLEIREGTSRPQSS